MVSAIEEIFQKTTGRTAGEIKPGLDRIRRVYRHLGEPGKKIRTVLVGGTNGKGSTSAFLYRMLTAQNHRVGLFTSPHLWNFSERVQVSNMIAGKIDDKRLEWEIRSLEADVPKDLYRQLSFFEINTLLALRVFDREEADFAILEVGLGGRWDSTNISSPEVTVITNIGWDHMEWLGDSLEKIAVEKSGIMRADKPVIWGDSNYVTGKVIEDKATSLNSELIAQSAIVEQSETVFKYKNLKQNFPEEVISSPSYLKQNFITASLAFEALLGEPPTGKLADAPTCQRGRFEKGVARNGCPYIIDVCHNVNGIDAFVKGLNELGLVSSKQKIYVSMLRDKEIGEILDKLTRMFKVGVFLSEHERGLRIEDIPKSYLKKISIYNSFSEVFDKHCSAEGPLIVCGSIIALAGCWSELETP
jgi:dihydrofolate synthase / folylpolyglutamate synthase